MRYCCLHNLLKDKKGLVGAEVGVWAGENARGLFECLDIKKLYLIDPYIPYQDGTQGGWIERPFDKSKSEMLIRIEGKPVEFIEEKSLDAVKKIKSKLDFVYIDAAHGYESVISDIKAWEQKVKKGGIIAGHDICLSDVKKAVSEHRGENFNIDNEDWYYEKLT